jgi:hypothetical protein
LAVSPARPPTYCEGRRTRWRATPGSAAAPSKRDAGRSVPEFSHIFGAAFPALDRGHAPIGTRAQ